ncbi:sialate O-acetylesterase [Cellulophaga baltica]|uniref:sialate O-acetylesterase n=1 Tax=Cellulophaga TaxID=104264 RepID=UPI001C06F769|nr:MULTISPECIES: sialate O-acetylesterase [Cellulophaga]MBU2995877.1 sialate O-acetylesterase [Cellulophaga baltica]MDO6767272.1 sialate O-acetylesterase [Cellulophaga sp. 1_MG-2023]
MKYLVISFIFLLVTHNLNAQHKPWDKNFPKEELKIIKIPNKENVWVFIMAGQSNMAGRAFVAPQDTITNKRILTINKTNDLIYAKEPFHFYESKMKGLDLGMSFSKTLLAKIPDSVSILILPTAVGGSSIEQWLENKNHRSVSLFENFEKKVTLGKTYGTIKGILWHQGESNTAKQTTIDNYDKNLGLLLTRFRTVANNDRLPVIIGEIGSYSKNKENWKQLNSKIWAYVKTDVFTKVVATQDLTHKGDQLHFNAKSIRILGKRYAEKFLE